MNEELETCRDALRQAAIFSPDWATRRACETAYREPSAATFAAVTKVSRCQYGPRLRSLMDAFEWEGVDVVSA